jgi:hypothetical protein
VTLEQLLHLVQRAERCALLPAEAARLRVGLHQLQDRADEAPRIQVQLNEARRALQIVLEGQALTTPAATQATDARCPSCEHEARFHDSGGRCWFTVEQGVPERDAVCSCQLRPPSLEDREGYHAPDDRWTLLNTSADIRPDPDTSIRTVSGRVLRGPVIDESGRPVTSTDTVHPDGGQDTVRPDTPPADTPGHPSGGVRVEYRATVPRHLLGAAVAEALGAIERETKGREPGEGEA